MADNTQFNHDRISHLLADRLLEVPAFQRNYSWDESNVADFLTDLETARHKELDYFLGTVVFANNNEGNSGRQMVVDGQQRLTTTAVILVAIRDRLRDFKKGEAAKHVDETFLRGFDLEVEELVERLVLNPDDQPVYDKLLARAELPEPGVSRLADAYRQVFAYLQELAPVESDYRKLIEITTQLDSSVQVLIAVASDLPEAYVIFETLNDRGADLTTADLLKNYLFSQAKQNFSYVQNSWTRISADFDKPAEFVKFIRYVYMSKNGHVTARNLYKAMQEDIGAGPSKTKAYVQRLEEAKLVYFALRDIDSPKWDSLDFDIKDSIIALRRFGLESSYPLIIAVFTRWEDEPRKAAKLLVKIVNWSIRAMIASKLGGGLAEKAFCVAAESVSNGSADSQEDVKIALGSLIVENAEFVSAFKSYGKIALPRAKYLLAMLERAYRQKNNESVQGLPEWNSRSVTLEHLMPRAEAKGNETKSSYVELLGNMALLEKTLNRGLEDKPFSEKAIHYKQSAFHLTSSIETEDSWNKAKVDNRMATLGKLATLAWPN